MVPIHQWNADFNNAEVFTIMFTVLSLVPRIECRDGSRETRQEAIS